MASGSLPRTPGLGSKKGPAHDYPPPEGKTFVLGVNPATIKQPRIKPMAGQRNYGKVTPDQVMEGGG